MSVKCMSWALNHAPVNEPVEVLILVAMAERANDDGTDTYQSISTIAKKARVSTRTVHRKLKELAEAGIIRPGDQRSAEHIPSNRRPVVYDLAIEKTSGDNLSPVTEESSSGDIQAVSGDIHDASAVTRMADNPSLDPSLDPSFLKSSSKSEKVYFPRDLTLTPAMRELATKSKPGLDPWLIFAKYSTYWMKMKPETKRTRSSWEGATWRNWVERETPPAWVKAEQLAIERERTRYAPPPVTDPELARRMAEWRGEA